jgi:hypothetical protein
MLGRVGDLEAAGLPLTVRGISDLAERRAAASAPLPGEGSITRSRTVSQTR